MRTRTLLGFVAMGLGYAAAANTNPIGLVLFGAALTLFTEEFILLCQT